MKLTPFPLIGQYRSGWVAFWLLVILLVNALVIGMADSIVRFETIWMAPFGILASVSGWILSGTQQKKGMFYIFGLFSGSMLLILFNSGAIDNLLRAVREVWTTISIFNPSQTALSKSRPIFYFLYLMTENIISFLNEASTGLINILNAKGNIDPLVITFVWGVILWSALFSTGWLFRRKIHALIASLPVLTLLMSMLGITRQTSSGLIMASGSILLLIVLLEHLRRENEWDHNQIDYSEELRFGIATLTIPVVIIILIVAWLIPNFSIKEIREFYNELIRNNRTDSSQLVENLGLDQVPVDSVNDSYDRRMPRSHLIGSSPDLSNILVMEINTGELFLPSQVDPVEPIPKYNWFGRSYDIYTGAGWKTSPITQSTIPAGGRINSQNNNYYRILTQTIRKTASAPRTLFNAGLPISVDHRITAGWRETTGEYFSAQVNTEKYQVQSYILNLSEDTLAHANELPPLEILGSYLDIPEDVPDRVLDLAHSITSETETPYEKAKSIESYLRNFEYSLELSPLPEDRDIVDYFLFDLQKGYCDYYASAMVILARASGLPARIVVGYATGHFDHSQQVFLITEANAHSWPEIYISPFGWVPFEPTAALETFSWTIDRTESITGDLPVSELRTPTSSLYNFVGLVGVVLVILLLGVLWFWITHREKETLSTTLQIENLYRRMISYLSQRFLSLQTTKTPLEYKQAVINALERQPSTMIHSRLIAQITIDLDAIVNFYHQGVYSPHPLRISEVIVARKAWRSLLVRTWILRFALTFKGA